MGPTFPVYREITLSTFMSFNWWSGERSAKYTRTQLSLWRESAWFPGKSCAWQTDWSLNANAVTYWLCEREQVTWLLSPGFCVSNDSGNAHFPEQWRSDVPTEPGLRWALSTWQLLICLKFGQVLSRGIILQKLLLCIKKSKAPFKETAGSITLRWKMGRRVQADLRDTEGFVPNHCNKQMSW